MNENLSTSGPKRQTGVGLSAETMQRIDRLRAVFGASRTRVIEDLIIGQLETAEKQHAAEIARFNRLAHAAETDNGTWQEYADWYAAAFSSKTFPPDIAELERRAGVSAPAS